MGDRELVSNPNNLLPESLHPFLDCESSSSLLKCITRQKSNLKKLENVSYNRDNKFSNLVNFSKSHNAPIHRWFKYREGYSPDIVLAFLGKDETKILDPFCGSGTTLVSAKQRGIDSIGIDINPMSAFISQAKVNHYSADDIEKLKNLAMNVCANYRNYEPSPLPKLKILDKVFDTEILNFLLRTKAAILSSTQDAQRDFLLLGWLAILESVSNTKKEGNGIKYKSTVRTKNGYVHVPNYVWQRKYFGPDKVTFAKKKLENQFELMLNDVKQIGHQQTSCKTNVLRHDSTRMAEVVSPNEISTTIFSPPYANCFDYFEIFKVELWMGGFVDDYKVLGDMRRGSLGSLWRDKMPVTKDIMVEELSDQLELIKEMGTWDKKVISMLQGYFSDMQAILEGIYVSLVQGGKCVIIVGNSAYSNIIIPTDLILANMGKKIGFDQQKIIIARELTTSSQQKKSLEQLKQYLRESIVVLEKS